MYQPYRQNIMPSLSRFDHICNSKRGRKITIINDKGFCVALFSSQIHCMKSFVSIRVFSAGDTSVSIPVRYW